MNKFFKGVLIGAGIGLLIAPMKGDEMRRLVAERLNQMRAYLPENEQLNMYTQQVSDRLSQTAGTLKDYAQQAASTVKSATSNIGDLTQKGASEVKQTGQDVADTTKRTAKSGASTTPYSDL